MKAYRSQQIQLTQLRLTVDDVADNLKNITNLLQDLVDNRNSVITELNIPVMNSNVPLERLEMELPFPDIIEFKDFDEKLRVDNQLQDKLVN